MSHADVDVKHSIDLNKTNTLYLLVVVMILLVFGSVFYTDDLNEIWNGKDGIVHGISNIFDEEN